MALQSISELSLSDLKKSFGELADIESERISIGLEDPVNSEWSMASATSRINSYRNRYTNVLPWEKTRVVLPVEDKQASDYVNASYINLHGKVRYIASQGPLVTTVHHFWSMCYNESEKQGNDTIIIAMVTPIIENDIAKCTQYWPDENSPSIDFTSSIQFDGISIAGLRVNFVSRSYNEEGEFLLSTFTLESHLKKKKVHHIYYYKWADSRTPPSLTSLYALSAIIKELKSNEANEPVPIIHCSAGVGRTGTFIVFDHLINNYDHSSMKDPVLTTVMQLRSERMMMVQTFSQFKFLYDFAREYLKSK